MATEIDYRYEEYKKFYPDTVKATLTMGKNLNKEQAQKLVEQYTEVQNSKAIYWNVSGRNILVYTSAQFKADAAKMIRGAKVVTAYPANITVESNGVIYCAGEATIRISSDVPDISGVCSAIYFKPAESEVNNEKG